MIAPSGSAATVSNTGPQAKAAAATKGRSDGFRDALKGTGRDSEKARHVETDKPDGRTAKSADKHHTTGSGAEATTKQSDKIAPEKVADDLPKETGTPAHEDWKQVLAVGERSTADPVVAEETVDDLDRDAAGADVRAEDQPVRVDSETPAPDGEAEAVLAAKDAPVSPTRWLESLLALGAVPSGPVAQGAEVDAAAPRTAAEAMPVGLPLRRQLAASTASATVRNSAETATPAQEQLPPDLDALDGKLRKMIEGDRKSGASTGATPRSDKVPAAGLNTNRIAPDFSGKASMIAGAKEAETGKDASSKPSAAGRALPDADVAPEQVRGVTATKPDTTAKASANVAEAAPKFLAAAGTGAQAAPAGSQPEPASRQVADALTRDLDTLSAQRMTMSAQGGQAGKVVKTMRLQLNPAELGTVNIRLQSVGGELKVSISADSEQTAHMLGRDSDAIRSVLRAAGIQAPDVSVSHHRADAAQPQTQGDQGRNAANQQLGGQESRGETSGESGRSFREGRSNDEMADRDGSNQRDTGNERGGDRVLI